MGVGRTRNPFTTMASELHWEADVPMLTNRLALQGLLLAFTPGILLIALMLYLSVSATEGIDDGFYYLLGLLALVAAGTIAVVFVVYRNRNRMSFSLDETGARYEVAKGQAASSGRINGLLFSLAALSGNPGGMGAAVLAQSRLADAFGWDEVKKADFHDDLPAVVLTGPFYRRFALYCTPDNYAPVKTYVTTRIDKKK